MNLTNPITKGLIASLCLSIPLQGQALVEPQDGVYTFERWENLAAGYDVNDLVLDSRFYNTPNLVTNKGPWVRDLKIYDGGRLRAYITAPETGNYTFWVSAKASGQIWLSTDETKYRKELIAQLGANSGTATAGVPSTSTNLWDKYASQMSEEIYLEAGQKYYFEALVKSGHASGHHIGLAWATPSQDRDFIPRSVISSYVIEEEDADDDFLPDDWETLYGLDVNDNGLFDLDRQGERGDFDGDSLNNRLEYVLGTDPTNADSDFDGLTDGEEYHQLQTNPAISDAADEVLVHSIDVGSYLSASGLTWLDTGNGFVASSFRGETSWSFEIPHDGYWIVSISTQLKGDLYLTEKVDFDFSFDGATAKTKTLTYGDNGFGVMRLVTPYLTAGSHQFSLNIDNLVARRSVSILAIDLLQPTGVDLDNDGLADWVFSAVQEANHVRPYQSISATSPAFIEGVAEDRNAVNVNGVTPEAGVDQDHWYANVLLAEEGSTEFTVDLTSRLGHTGNIQWVATNIFETSTLTVRKGDSIKLNAQNLTASTAGTGSNIRLAPSNLLLESGATATQLSTASSGLAKYAIDGNKDGAFSKKSVTHTANQGGVWWQVEFDSPKLIEGVVLWNRTDSENIMKRLSAYRINVYNESGQIVASQSFHTNGTYTRESETWVLPTPVVGQRVRVQRIGKNLLGDYVLSLAEVEVLGNSLDIPLESDSDYYVYQCDSAGLKTFTVTDINGATSTLTVDVKAINSQSTQDYVNNVVGVLNQPSSSTTQGIVADGGDSVGLTHLGGSGLNYQIRSQNRGSANILWRLYEEGPVLDKQEINFIGFADAAQTDSTQTFFSREFSGYNLVTTPIVFTDLPVDAKIVVNIHRNGVTFLDGTKKLTLSPSEFKNGIYTLEFLFPIGMQGGYCHYVSVYDRDGNLITTR